MAVANIDTVYQRVLALANKEQRGYITPQEFNLLAGKAQNDIFEMYFHDYKTALLSPGNQSKMADDLDILREKIAMHKVVGTALTGDNKTLSNDVHWLESVYSGDDVFEEVDRDQWSYMKSNNKLRPSKNSRGVFLRTGANAIILSPSNLNHVDTAAAYYSSNLVDNSSFSNSIKRGWDTTGSNYFWTLDGNGPQTTITIDPSEGELKFEGAVEGAVAETTARVFENGKTYEAKINIESISSGKVKFLANYDGATESTHFGPDHVDESHELYDASLFTHTMKVETTVRGTLEVYATLNNTTAVINSITVREVVLYDYIKRPANPQWGFTLLNGKALYNSATTHTTPFELHSSEESTLTNKILELAGIVLNKPGLSEVILRNEAVKEANKNK